MASVDRSSEGAWSPVGQRIDDSEILFIGDSIFRYLSGHIPNEINGLVPGVCFLSGAQVDTILSTCAQYVSQKTRLCLTPVVRSHRFNLLKHIILIVLVKADVMLQEVST